MKQQNKWEKLFDEFLELTEFTLVRHQNDWSLIDHRDDTSDIEEYRFKNTMEIFLRLDGHTDYYIIGAIEDVASSKGIDISDWENWGWDYLLTYRDKFPQNYQWHFDVIDMICCHDEEINLENCTYEEE